MLRAGLHAVWLRYPLALAVAHGVFLTLARVWIAMLGRRLRRLSTERGCTPRGSDLSGFLLTVVLSIISGSPI